MCIKIFHIQFNICEITICLSDVYMGSSSWSARLIVKSLQQNICLPNSRLYNEIQFLRSLFVIYFKYLRDWLTEVFLRV